MRAELAAALLELLAGGAALVSELGMTKHVRSGLASSLQTQRTALERLLGL